MKKLMTTLSAVGVALGLYAATGDISGTSFEGLDAGAYNIYTNGAAANAGGELAPVGENQTFWSNVTESATLTISADGVYEGDERPATYGRVTNEKYLDVKTTLGNPVYRNVNVDGAPRYIEDGVYFDSLVKFTAFEDEESVPSLVSGGKLAIWLKQDDPDNPSVTNLMITAGYLGAGWTNYTCHVDGDVGNVKFNDGGWHRVTVKSISSIYDTSKYAETPGFVVYIDGNRVQTESITGINSKGIEVSKLTPAAAYEHTTMLGALFPSADQESADRFAITSVAFDGQGAVDDILFTSVDPFQGATEFFTINAGLNVESLEYTDNDSQSGTVGAGGTAVIAYTNGINVTITPTYSDGCVDGTWTPAEIVEGHVVKPTADGQSVTVNGVFSRASVIYVEDNVVKTNYSATAAAAFTFINNTGAGDYYVSLSDAATEGGINLNATGANVILDLAGTNITAGASDSAAIYIENGALTITNSVEGVGGIVDAGSAAAAVASIGSDALTIEAGTYNGLVSADSATPFAINGGAFDKASNDGMLGSAVLPAGKVLVDGTGDFAGYLVLGEEPDSWQKRLGPAVGGAYLIDNLAELKSFQEGCATNTASENQPALSTDGITFKLTADIALDEPWPGIGLQNGKDIYNKSTFTNCAFRGTFDGQNHTISGFQMVGGNLDYCGFFNSTLGATIQNLKIQYAGSYFAADTSTGSTSECGATFVGVAHASTLKNLTTLAGSVTCAKGFGGIAGFVTSGTTVESCTNNVNLTSSANNKAGGVVMVTQGGTGTATIRNCVNNGTTTGNNNQKGGIIGYLGTDGSVVIENCIDNAGYAPTFFSYNKGTVTVSGVNKASASAVPCKTNTGADKVVSGLTFATVDGGVATFVADNALALNGSYKVMVGGAAPTFVFTEAGTISFDTNLTQNVSFDGISMAEGLEKTEATAGGVVTFTATESSSEIDPQKEVLAVDVTATDATDATNKVEVAVPTGSGADAAEYKALFKLTAKLKSEGVYTVEITGIKDEVVADVSADAVDALTDTTKTAIEIPAGLYYRISPGAALPITITTVSTRQGLSTGSVDKPTITGGDGSKGFYKVELSPKPFPVLPPES